MKRSHDFLGIEVSGTIRDRAYVIPVPVELSVSYGAGTAHAPRAMLDASMQIEVYNALLGVDLEGAGIVTLDPGVRSKAELISFVSEKRSMLCGAFSCFLGGEHSITPWILEGLSLGDAGIVWLDAHADCRESYQDNPESHACAARNSLRFGPMVQVGVRSYSREERDFMRDEKRLRSFERWSAEAREAIRRLPDCIYLSIDFDALDPSVIRAVGTPEPGGLAYAEVLDILDACFDGKDVVAIDAVELAPREGDEASSFIAAKIVYEALSRRLRRELRSET